jgi:hypothetical protein
MTARLCLLCGQPAVRHTWELCRATVGDRWRPRVVALQGTVTARYHAPEHTTVRAGDTVRTHLHSETPDEGPVSVTVPNPDPRHALVAGLRRWLSDRRGQVVIDPFVPEGTLLVGQQPSTPFGPTLLCLFIHPTDAGRLTVSEPDLAEDAGFTPHVDTTGDPVDVPVPPEGWDPDPPSEMDDPMGLHVLFGPAPRWVYELGARARQLGAPALHVHGSEWRNLLTAKWLADITTRGYSGVGFDPSRLVILGLPVLIDPRVPENVVRLYPRESR